MKSRAARVYDTYVDHLVYTLGDTKTHLKESEEHGRLHSSADDLAAAGFTWHHVCDSPTTAYDLAKRAMDRLPESALASGCDAIIYATCLPQNGNVGSRLAWESTRDVTHLMEFPVSRLQADYGLDSAIAIGLNQQACTGMLGALRIAGSLLATEPDWERVLCVTADRFPEGALYEQSYNLISDGAAACLVSRRPNGFRLITGHQITNGGLWAATDDERIGSYFSYTTRAITETLQRADLSIADISWIVPQNTNQKAWSIMSRLLGIPADRVWQSTIADIGHATSADNIINLSSLVESGRVLPGQRILLLMAGHGLNWQVTVLEATGEIAVPD